MIRFSSRAAADIWMVDTHAAQLLEIVGRSADEPGVLTPAQLPAALDRLKAAIERERELLQGQQQNENQAATPTEDFVELGRRAFPLMEMMERALRKNKEVAWKI